MLKLYKNDLNYCNVFFRGETLGHYLLNVILNPFSPCDGTILKGVLYRGMWFFTGDAV